MNDKTGKRKLKGHKPPFSRLVRESAKEAGLYPYFLPVTGEQAHIVDINGKKTIMLGSNNYLGMTEHPDVKEAAKKAIDKYGVGCTGSRYLNGTLDIHLEMENLLAEFMERESALMFSSGYHTNVGTLYSLACREDTIFSDAYNHASIVDGCKLSQAEVVVYQHNDARSLKESISTISEDRGAMCITDGVFSMEGDIAELPSIGKVCNDEEILLMVDDAHSIGVMGNHGRGTANHYNLDVDLTMGTFSKSLASQGGFITGDLDIVDEVKHSARALIFSAAPPPANVATARKALEIFMNDDSYRQKLWKNAAYLKKGLKDLGFNIGNTDSPILPVIIGFDATTMAYWHQLLESGIYTNPVIYPATPKDRCLLRNSVMATHTIDDLNKAIDAYEKVLEMIPLDDEDE